MARKGKEPAGLRRWRLAQKRKTAGRKARRTAPKRTVRTMARRRYSKKRYGGRKSKSITGMIRGGMYVAIPAFTTYQDYSNLKSAGRSTSDALAQALGSWAGISPTSMAEGKPAFDFGTLAGNWTPVAAWTAVDWVAGRAGVWRKMGKMLR